MFGSSKRIYVASSAVPLMEEIPNTLKNSVFKSVYQTRDMPLGMIDDLVNGINLTVNRSIRLGKKDYIHGLPNAKLVFETFNVQGVQTVLEGIENTPIEIVNITLSDNMVDANLNYHLYTELGLKSDNTFTNESSGVSGAIQAFRNEIEAGNPARMNALKNQWDNTSSSSSTTDITDTEGNVTGTTTTTTSSTETHSLSVASVSYDPNNYIQLSTLVDAVDLTPTGNYFGDDYYSAKNLNTRHKITINFNIQFFNVTTTYNVSHSTTTTTCVDGVCSTSNSENTYQYTETIDPSKTGTHTYDYYAPMSSDGSVYQVTYKIVGNDVIKFWVYNPNDKTHSSLDFNEVENIDDKTFPIIRLRYNNKFIDRPENLESEEYISTKKMMKSLGLDLSEVTEQLDANPDIDDIDHAYILSGINLHTETNKGRKYLVEFFKYLHARSLGAKSEFISWLASYEASVNGGGIGNVSSAQGKSIFEFKDAGLNVSIGFRYIEVETFNGKYKVDAKRGDIDSEDIIDIRQYQRDKDSGGIWFGFLRTIDVSKKIFKHQISDDEYEIITVVGPEHKNTIYGNTSVTTGIKESQQEDDSNFWIPLFMPVAKNLNIVERDLLYHESMIMVVNSVEIVKVKWYQSAFFKFLLMAVALYFGAPGLGEFAAGLSAAAAGGAMAVISFLAPMLFKAVAMQIVMELAVNVLGEEFAMIVAIAILVMGFGKLDSIGNFDLPFADKFLAIGSNLIKTITASIQAEIEGILNETMEFSKEAAEKMDALNEINKELNGLLKIDPFVFIGHSPMFIKGEDPNEFFARTLGIAKSGERSIESVSKFVDIMLQLPPINDSLKDLDEEIEQ